MTPQCTILTETCFHAFSVDTSIQLADDRKHDLTLLFAVLLFVSCLYLFLGMTIWSPTNPKRLHTLLQLFTLPQLSFCNQIINKYSISISRCFHFDSSLLSASASTALRFFPSITLPSPHGLINPLSPPHLSLLHHDQKNATAAPQPRSQ